MNIKTRCNSDSNNYDKNRFSLKTISKNKVMKIMKKLKRKKGAGVDGLCQDQLILGASVIKRCEINIL